MDHRHLVILSFTCTYSSVFNFEGEAQREPALKLVASLIGQVGMEFILPPNTKDNKVLLMIIHLSCIEVRITLENLPIQKVSVKLIVTISLSILITLYSIQSLLVCFICDVLSVNVQLKIHQKSSFSMYRLFVIFINLRITYFGQCLLKFHVKRLQIFRFVRRQTCYVLAITCWKTS